MIKFNMIGFNFPRDPPENPEKYKHCVIHPGNRLIPKIDQPDLLWCPICGTSYQEKDTLTDERFMPKFGTQSKTRIITAKKKKKYYDDNGNDITDETLLQDIARGAHVISYREEKSG